LVFAVGCRREASDRADAVAATTRRPLIVAEPVGVRAVASLGGSQLPVWDSARPPALRLPRADEVTQVAWRTPSGRLDLKLERSGEQLAIIDWPTCASLTEGQLEFEPSGIFATLNAACAPDPSSLGGVKTAKLCNKDPQVCALHVDPWESAWCAFETARCLAREQGSSAPWWSFAATADALGVPSLAASAARIAVYRALAAHDLVEAPLALARAVEYENEAPTVEGELRTAYYRGLVSIASGDMRRGIEALEAGLARADLPRLDEDRCHLSTALADAYGQTGQWTRAQELIPALSTRSCSLVNKSSAVSVAWTRFAVARSQGTIAAATLRVELKDAIAFARKPPSDPFLMAVASLNLALFELHVGELDAAERALDEFDTLGSARGHFGAFDALHARGEIALGRGQPRDALGFFERALARARSDAAGQASDAEWRALFGQGLALRALKKDAEGLARLRAAVEVQERAGLRTALRAGRAAFFDDRRALVNALTDAYLGQGDLAALFELTDAVGARVLRTLESSVRAERLSPSAREAYLRRVTDYSRARSAFEAGAAREAELSGRALAEWRTARLADERDLTARFEAVYELLDREAPTALPAAASAQAAQARLGEREALVAFARAPNAEVALVLKRDEITGVHLEGAAPVSLLDAALEGVDRVVVVAGASSTAFDLPVMGSPPLATRKTVTFTPYAGLWVRGASPMTGEGRLIVADPESNLPSARGEGTRLGALLGANVRLAIGRDATRAQVLEALATSRLFHFAGHGELAPDDPWSARLRLAEGQSLTLSDLLLEAPRPTLVVLNGCSTGVRLALGRHDRVGLPEAFLVAGAAAVLATDDEVEDSQARTFVERFYAGSPLEDPGLAYRRAVAASHAAGERGWEKFRIFEVAHFSEKKSVGPR
jgi:hypothetical protein